VSDDVEVRLPGGNVGGAVRVGDTVRRQTGPWTPAVHALLEFLAPRVPHIPTVLGVDEQGREILTYLPGHLVEAEVEMVTPAQIASMVRWTRALHEAVADFTHPGPWRFFPMSPTTLIGHNDIAPYNVCFRGDDVVGVFDWDLAGPTTPLYELAFIAWNCVPLWRDIGADLAAARLHLIAQTYGGPSAREILLAVPARINLMLDGIPVAAAAGDAGMVNLLAVGEPGRSRRSLNGLLARLPAIEAALI
jgi:Phosphotransferase enzyme family